MQLASNPISTKPASTQPPLFLELARRYDSYRCERGEVLVEPGEPATYVHVLTSGVARVFTRYEDHELLLELVKAPAVIGEAELVENVPFLSTVVALEPLELHLVPAAEYQAFIRGTPAARAEQAKRLAARVRLATRVQRRMVAPVDVRIADLLLSLVEIYGRRVGPEVVCINPLTQEELASSLGLVRRSVNGTLSRWRRDGLISHRGRNILIHAPARLAALVGELRGSSEVPAPGQTAPLAVGRSRPFLEAESG